MFKYTTEVMAWQSWSRIVIQNVLLMMRWVLLCFDFEFISLYIGIASVVVGKRDCILTNIAIPKYMDKIFGT